MTGSALNWIATVVGSPHLPLTSRGIDFAISPYPPSFDNNPILFAWALFARMFIVMMCSATLVRVVSRTRRQGLAANDPVVLQRVTWCAFMTASGLGGLSDTLTYMFWGETSPMATAVILMLARISDGMTMFPFITGLFAPLVVQTLIRAGVFKGRGLIALHGIGHDIRSTWDAPDIPVRLAITCGAASLCLTVAKYGLWVGHGRH